MNAWFSITVKGSTLELMPILNSINPLLPSLSEAESGSSIWLFKNAREPAFNEYSKGWEELVNLKDSQSKWSDNWSTIITRLAA